MPARFLQAVLFLLLALMAGKLMAAELNLTQNQFPVALGPYLDHLEDATGQLNISDIINGNFDWQRSKQSIPTLGMSASAHWFSIVFTGDQVPEDELLLSLASPTLDRAEFYFVQNKQIVKQAVSGDTIPFSDLEFPYRYPIVPFQLSNADQTTVYIRVQSISGVEMQLGLTTAVLLISEQQADFVFFGAFYTFFILSFCFCAIIYYAWRESQFRGYTLFFGASIVFFLAENGTGRLWLWGDQGDFNNRLAYVSAIAMIASFCLLGQSLNLNNRYRDSVVIVLRFITFATIPLGLYFFMVPIEQITTGNVLMIMYLALTVALTVFVMTGITALKGSRSAVYLFFFWVFLVLAYASFLIFRLNISERSPAYSMIAQSLVFLAALLIMLSLFEFIRVKNAEFSRARLETKAKGDFLKNMSREFLTPVHLILANSKRLMADQSNKLDAATEKHMHTVIKQSDHLHKLINDLLEMAELESDSF